MNPQPPIPDTQQEDSQRGLNSPWFRRHAVFAPFGVFIATWLMCWSDTGDWRCWSDWSATSSLVDLAVIIYGMIAVLIEKGLDAMFWALEQRKKRIARYRAEMKAEARAEMLAELQAKARLREEGEPVDAWLERMGRELEDGRKN